MESLWRNTSQIPPHEPLKGDLKTDVLIIGGGMAGILTAYLLKQKGVEYAVIEAERIADGVTQNTTAKITSQHGVIYSRLIKSYGQECTAQYAECSKRAIAMFQSIIETEKIDCGFEIIPAYLYATENADLIEKEYLAAISVGLCAHETDETGLPFPVKAALCFKNQAQFHPLLFLAHISKELRVFEHTKALSVEGDTVICENGRIEAKQIIFATHFPFINVPGYYFLRMHQERSYVLALTPAANVGGAYLGVDGDKYSFRNHGEYLLFGGGGHRTGMNEGGGKYKALTERAQAFYPRSREAFRWSAQDCMTHDGVPYIGRFAIPRENWYVATGFNKWGMTGSMSAAMILSEELAGGNLGYDIFSPQRHNITPSAKGLTFDVYESAAGLLKRGLQIPREQPEEVPAGCGAVVEYDGKKLGVYRAPDGKVFTVSVKCPHLGCQLSWNPDELSWDCPCHGSRFDYKGTPINNPAQNGLDG